MKLQLKDLAKRLGDQNLGLTVDDAALALLVRKGYDPAFGARPVKRAIQRELENPIAKALVAGRYAPGDTIAVTAQGDEIVI